MTEQIMLPSCPHCGAPEPKPVESSFCNELYVCEWCGGIITGPQPPEKQPDNELRGVLILKDIPEEQWEAALSELPFLWELRPRLSMVDAARFEFEGFRRLDLVDKLRDWGFPMRLAYWIAWRWPQRWLPKLEGAD